MSTPIQSSRPANVLPEPEQLLHNLLTASPYGILLLEPLRNEAGEVEDLIFILVNEAAAELMYYPVETLQGKGFRQLFPVQANSILPHYLQVLATGDPINLDYHFQGDNRERWIDINVTPHGTGLLVTFFDVSNSRRTERQLKEREHFISETLNAAPNLIGIYDLEVQRTVYANRNLEEMLGYTPRQLAEWGAGALFKLVHPEDIQGFIERNEKLRAAKDNELVHQEYRALAADGDWRWFRSVAKVFKRRPSGEVWQYIATGEDITAIKIAEAKLRRSQRLNEQIANISPTLITVTNAASGQYVFVNKAWKHLLGYEEEDLYQGGAEFVFSIIHPDDRPKALQWLMDLAEATRPPNPASEPILDIDYRIRRMDGSWIWVSTHAMALDRNAEGQVEHFISSSLDITEKKQAEAELQRINLNLERRVRERTAELEKANQELQLINRDLDNFIYTASHDLRAPIANIEGLVNVLRGLVPEDVAANEDFAEVMGLIAQSVHRFRNTVADLSRITTSVRDIRLDVKEQALEPLIEDVAFDLASTIEETGARLEADVSACPTVVFSRGNLRSVLYNLISNGIKYRSPERAPVIHIQSERLPEGVLLRVSDNGLGIPARHLNKVFSMFKRLHPEVEGSGVGLYIVKRIVESAGGTIALESEEGVGTVFSVFFPQRQLAVGG